MKKIMSTISIIILALGISWQALASGGGDSSDDFRLKDITQFNLNENVGLKGYDPVSYFEEGGSDPQEGTDEFTADFGGVTYKFANEKNLNLFLDEVSKNERLNIKTLKYEPTYGGWCAYVMGLNGGKIDINPESYDFTGDRLHVFADGAKEPWLADKEKLERSADRRWNRILKRARR